jgi:hypothetical protein
VRGVRRGGGANQRAVGVTHQSGASADIGTLSEMWRAPAWPGSIFVHERFRSSRFGPIVPLRRADKLGVLEAVRERVARADARDLKQ